MTRLCREISSSRNCNWLDWTGEILVDEAGKKGSWVGRNFAYKPIVVKDERDLLGKALMIHVKKAFPTYLEGEILE
jgi:tRNA A37 methylthiotransferase MiaB